MDNNKPMICYLCTDPTENVPIPNPLYRCSGTGHSIMARICDSCQEPCAGCEGDIYECQCKRGLPESRFIDMNSVEIVEIDTGVVKG